MQTRPLDLDTLQLARGSHPNHDAMCILEAAAFIAGEDWTDAPECVSPVIRSFCIAWNDQLADEPRNRLLRPFVTKVIGTRTTPEDEQTRAWLATDWLVRTFTPAWLRKAGLTDHADRLANLDAITSTGLCNQAIPIINEARKKATAAWDAAWAAAWTAVRAAAWTAVRAAVRAAAWDAVRDAAWDAAWTVAGTAAWDAVRDAAWDAAWTVAGTAAWAAAGTVAGTAAWDAAWTAAGAALADTVAELQQSAVDLLDRMCAVGR